MKIGFKIAAALLATVRIDLRRPHPCAHERVGFISAGLSAVGDDVLILARSYRPVLDQDYLRDPSVGAMMGPEALRKALQWAMQTGAALFHVHTHGGRGLPDFSSVDLRENPKFMPDFCNVAPQSIHGAIVLSDTAARGQVWLAADRRHTFIERFTQVGAPIVTWRAA
jgi:hypothetical protein